MSGIVGGINLRSSGLVNLGSSADGTVFTGTGLGLPVGFEAAAAAGGTLIGTMTDTYNTATASGTVAYTGCGFQPDAVQIVWGVGNAPFLGPVLAPWIIPNSVDQGENKTTQCFQHNEQGLAASWQFEGTYFLWEYYTPASNYVRATLSSMDADGFTMSYTKGGSPVGTFNMISTCFKY